MFSASERLTLNNPTKAVGVVWGSRKQGRGKSVPEARVLCVGEYEPVIDVIAESASLRDAEFACMHTSPHCAKRANAPSLMWGYEEYVPSAHSAKMTPTPPKHRRRYIEGT